MKGECPHTHVRVNRFHDGNSFYESRHCEACGISLDGLAASEKCPHLKLVRMQKEDGGLYSCARCGATTSVEFPSLSELTRTNSQE